MPKYAIHTVGSGDTIQSIGEMYNADWTEIVNINGLEYPYICDDEEDDYYQYMDTVAKLGTNLLIPSDGISFPIKTNDFSDEVERYAFGTDLDLYTNSETINKVVDLESEGELISNGLGDIKLSEGILNLRQQLITRLGTPKGALLLHPSYGSNILNYIGKRINTDVLTDIKLEIQECLLGDFRVDGVGEINVTFADNSVHVECEIKPIEPYSSTFTLSNTYYSE